MTEIDLSSYFSPEALLISFEKLIEAKTDSFSDIVKISMGSDGITFEDFEKNIDRNISEISRKVLAGNYFFYPLREIDILKDETNPAGGSRTLSIARIRDVLVQKQLYEALYSRFETLFTIQSVDKVSFAYRKGKTTHDAIRGIWRDYRRGYEYVLDADLSKFFDTLDHGRLRNLLEESLGDNTIALNLLWRYARVPSVKHKIYSDMKTTEWKKYFMENKPPRVKRQMGVPQGGVLSGMLANLYLHSFDRWLVETVRPEYDLRYYRYADDFVVLTRSMEDAGKLYSLVENYISGIQLKLHPLDSEKTRLIHIPQSGLEFLGFRITKNKIEIKHKNIIRFKRNFKRSIERIEHPEFPFRNSIHRLEVLIKYYVNTKILGSEDICPTCQKPILHRNWMSYFAPVITNMHQIHDLDVWMRKTLRRYLWENFKVRTKPRDFKRHGMMSLMKEFRRCHEIELCTCEPELSDRVTKYDADTSDSSSITI